MLVAVEIVGICGSDLHAWTGHHPYFDYPRVQGHEFGGRVVAIGDAVPGSRPLVVGERVAVEPLIACGACVACRRGRSNCCVRLKVLGSHVDGALTEQLVVPAAACHAVIDLDPALTALVEPMSIGLQAVARSRIEAGGRVVILGAGPIGQAILICALDRGAEALVVDRLAPRLDLAQSLGAAAIVNTVSEDLGAAVQAWTDGEGPIAVFEVTGVPSLLRTAVDIVASSGTVVVVGLSQDEVSLPIIEFTRKELAIVGSRNSAGLFPAAVDLVRRRRGLVQRLVTRRYPFDKAADAMDFALKDPGATAKVLVDVSESNEVNS
ncbi:MAG: alcohol dehydrogenase catalytic domain-containing protein [Chloroflexota bacterium]